MSIGRYEEIVVSSELGYRQQMRGGCLQSFDPPNGMNILFIEQITTTGIEQTTTQSRRDRHRPLRQLTDRIRWMMDMSARPKAFNDAARSSIYDVPLPFRSK